MKHLEACVHYISSKGRQLYPQAKTEKLGWHSHKRQGEQLGNQATHSLVESGRKAFWMSFIYYWKEQIEFRKKDCSELEKG